MVQSRYTPKRFNIISKGVFTLTVSGTRTGIGTRTNILQKPFTPVVYGARTGHLKATEIQLKHTN